MFYKARGLGHTDTSVVVISDIIVIQVLTQGDDSLFLRIAFDGVYLTRWIARMAELCGPTFPDMFQGEGPTQGISFQPPGRLP